MLGVMGLVLLDYVVITDGYDDHLARNLDHSSHHDGADGAKRGFKTQT